MAADPTAEAASSGGLPQLNFETWPSQILWLVISLALLFFFLNRFVLPRVALTLEERRDTIAGDLDLAADYDRKARDAEASYKAALDTARAEARRIADKTQTQIREELNVAVAEADKRIAAQAAASAERIAGIKAEAGQKAAEVAEATAAALLEKLSPTAQSAASVKKAVKSALSSRLDGI
ncbi:MAG: F0F1 ATP synthase subunit B' [Pseudomonadota bacterium]